MARLVAVLAAAAILGGCVTASPVALPDGSQGFSIRCDGATRDVSSCMNKAAEVCGGPYKIVTGSNESNGGVITPVGNGAMFVAGRHRNMIVACGK
jgi:hypothetical protein